MADQTKTVSAEVLFGEERTNANDFEMIGGTAQDANNLELALLHLQDSPYASSIVDAAAGGTVEFNHTDLYADEALADGAGVIWNPDVGLQLSDGDIISPAAALGSEFAHQVLDGGLDQNATSDALWENSAEAIAHTAANEFGAELGEPQRNGYADGTPVLVEGVTDFVNGDTIDTSGTASGSVDAGGFEAGAYADYGVSDHGADAGDGSGYDFQTVEDAIEIVGTAGASEAAELAG